MDITRDGTTAKSGTQSCKVNGTNKPLGVWKSIAVTKGDKVTAQVYAHYKENLPTNSTSNFTWLPFLIPSYGNPNGETLFNPQTLSGGLIVVPNNTNNTSNVKLPNAYLRMQEYNEAGILVEDRVQFISGAFLNNWSNQLSLAYTAKDNGRIEVFVANESDKDVWFDDLSLTYEQHMIVQENHYYAFGMNMAGIGKVGKPANKFQYNGKEFQPDFDLNWNDYGWRNYDGVLGRWHGVDKLAEKYQANSPYHYAYNNPMKYIDPNGKEIWIYYQEEKIDKKGNIVTKKGETQYVTKSVQYKNGKLYDDKGKEYKGNNVFLSETVKSLNTLQESKADVNALSPSLDRGLIKDLTESEQKLYIKENMSRLRGNGYDAKTNTLTFDYKYAVRFFDEDTKETVANHPSMIQLMHELGHGWRDIFKNVGPFNASPESLGELAQEEQYITKYVEDAAAKRLGFKERNDYTKYGHEFYKAKNAQSTEGAKDE